MDKHTKIWLKAMEIAKKYCGCHQIAERSFFFQGYQFPLCARCTGCVVGYLVSIILLVCRLNASFGVSLLLIIPLIVDGMIQLVLNIMSNNIRRFITGLLFGIGFIQVLSNIVVFIIK